VVQEVGVLSGLVPYKGSFSESDDYCHPSASYLEGTGGLGL